MLSGTKFVVLKNQKIVSTPTDRIKNTVFLLFLWIFGFLKIKVPEQVSLSTERFLLFSKNMIFMFCLLVSTKNTFLMLFFTTKYRFDSEIIDVDCFLISWGGPLGFANYDVGRDT